MSRSSGTFKDQAEKYYDNISDTYNQNMINSMKSTTEAALNEIKLQPNSICLDIACGTGISTLLLAEKCSGNATIYGIDISEKMIDEAIKIIKQQKIDNIIYYRMDAENLVFPDSTFDFVLSNMALYLFPDKQKALSEVYRVLKPGGQFAFTYVAGPHYREELQLFHNLATRHPEIPALLKSVEEAMSYFLSLEESISLFTSVGLRLGNIYGRHRVGWIDSGQLVGDSNQNVWWSIFRQKLLREEIDLISSETLEAVKPQLDTNGKFKVTSYVIIAAGNKP